MQKVAYFTVQHHDFASVYKFDNLMLMIVLLNNTNIYTLYKRTLPFLLVNINDS